MVNAASLTKNNREEYVEYVGNIIHACLPDEAQQPELYNLVKTYQRKYKNQACRFHSGKIFSKHTIVAEPLSSDIP